MDQKKLYTDFWNLLSETEDYIKYGMKSQRSGTPVITIGEPVPEKSELKSEVQEIVSNSENCMNCPMLKAGKKAMPLYGNPNSDLWVVTDPPLLEAEKINRPLSESEMDYFQKWMSAIDISLPDDLLLQNLTRCRTPGNRPPFPEEMSRCAKEILSRLEHHRPKVILAMGSACASWFTSQKGMKVSEIRGKLYTWQGIPLIVTYSPDQVLSYGELKRPVWEDLKSLRNVLSGS